MDTSATYIKMCEKAKEIQGLRNGFSSDDYGEIWLVGKNFQTHNGKAYVGGIWLPRQDQLQEIMQFTNLHEMLDRFDLFRQDFFGAFSMEQLWLAFVMKEKYGKTWNGEDWVGSESSKPI